MQHTVEAGFNDVSVRTLHLKCLNCKLLINYKAMIEQLQNDFSIKSLLEQSHPIKPNYFKSPTTVS